ncbi:MAG: hypothetical protein ACK41V_23510, partial [Acidovorax sp.]|uniref:hypothetical protein n=1 Tax=Acidovorax sp. TaxID=1872122 RepID=UPI003919DBFD
MFGVNEQHQLVVLRAELECDRVRLFTLTVRLSDGELDSAGTVVVHVLEVARPPLFPPALRVVGEHAAPRTPIGAPLLAFARDERETLTYRFVS